MLLVYRIWFSFFEGFSGGQEFTVRVLYWPHPASEVHVSLEPRYNYV